MGSATFSIADYLVFSSSLLLSLLIGLYQWYKGRGKDTKDFYLGGGEMSVVPVALSYMAGIISAVSVLGNSSEMYYYGSQLWMNLLGVVFGGFVLVFVLIPVIYPLQLITIYEFLELRWGSTHMRKLATIYKMIDLVIYMGIALYAPSLAISAVTPISVNNSIIVMGLICCAYASLGGAKAVVYTDTFQAAVMVAGVVMVIVEGCSEAGGASNAWAIDKQHGRIEFFNFNPSPLVRHTFFTTFAAGIHLSVSLGGVTQAQYQRWASVSTIGQSYGVVILGTLAMITIWSLINFSGLVVFAVYAECDPLTQGDIDKPDQVVMHFVADKLGHLQGVMGLFVAAVYSAVLSSFVHPPPRKDADSVSSSINAVAAMLWKDLMQPLKIFAKVKEEKVKNINMILSACTGLLAVLLGFVAGSLGGLVQMTYALGGALGGPVAGIFFTAILCPWVKMWSAFVAALCSLAFCLWIVIGNFLYAGAPEMLDLSIDGCYDNATTTTTMLTTTSITSTGSQDPEDGEVFVLYRLSYCLFSIIGMLSTPLLSTVFSCVFGFAEPSSVPVATVDKTCLRFYCWVRGEEVPRQEQQTTSDCEKFPHSKNLHDSISGKDASLKAESDATPEVTRKECQGEDNPITVEDSL